MANTSTRPYRRRNFFVKQWFQLGFALYPILFLVAFLSVGGLYLERQLRETLEFYLYLPHGGLTNPWEVVGPAVLRVAVAGGGAFLLALGVWGWRRFARLHQDLGALAEWLRAVVEGRRGAALSPLRDPEVRSLGLGLEKAAQGFEAWDAEVDGCAEALRESLERLRDGPSQELPQGLAAARERWRAFSGELSRMKVEEDLS